MNESLLWSGPGRALQAHLDTFEVADRVLKGPNGDATINEVAELAVDQRLFGDDFNSLPERQRFWMSFARSYGFEGEPNEGDTAAAQEDARRPVNSRANVARAEIMRRNEYRMLNEGVTHYISMEMADMITQAAALAEPEPLFPTDLPCPHGIAILEYPVIFPDLHPDTGVIDTRITLPIRAVGWSANESFPRRNPDGTMERVSGITLVLYTDVKSYASIYQPSILAISPESTFADPGWKAPLLPIEVNPWGYGTVWSDGGLTFDKVDSWKVVTSVAQERRWALALFRLMWQRILNPEPWAPPRADRRRADRAGWVRRPEATDVKVLRLRRLATDVDDPTRRPDEAGWTLDHRIVVRGHWRRQWYPSLGPVEADESHRMIWIDTHVKGPEGTPLVIKHNVTALVR